MGEVSISYAKHLLECAQQHKQIPAFATLSTREQEIFLLLSEGASNKEIAGGYFYQKVQYASIFQGFIVS